MLVYRYERLDGGGPFFNPYGKVRYNITHLGPIVGNGYLSGCLSQALLDKYWANQKNSKYYLKDCILKIYDIPKNEIIHSQEHIYFPKHYKPIN